MSNYVVSQQIVVGLLQILDPVPGILFLMYIDSRHHMPRNIDCTSKHLVFSLCIGHFVYILRCWRKSEFVCVTVWHPFLPSFQSSVLTYCVQQLTGGNEWINLRMLNTV